MFSDRYYQQLLSYQKLGLKNWQQFATSTQSLSFDTGTKLLDIHDWIPAENKVYAKKIQTYATQTLKRFNSYLDNAFSVYEKLFTSSKKQSSPKTKSTNPPRIEGKA